MSSILSREKNGDFGKQPSPFLKNNKRSFGQIYLCEVGEIVDHSARYGWDEWKFQKNFTLCTYHRDVKAFELSNGDVVIYEREYDILWDNEIVWYDPIVYNLDGTIYPPSDELKELLNEQAL